MAENYNPGREQYQATASPNISTVQASTDPGDRGVAQLSAALGLVGPVAGQFQANSDAREGEAARSFANSKTLADLGKMITSGEILPSQSPAYAAVVQNVYGENLLQEKQRDFISQVIRGELKFADNAAVDQHIVDMRNKALQGASKFTIAGFDKGWDTFGQTAINAVARKNDADFVAHGTQVATDSLLSTVDNVSGPGFPGTPQQAATALMDRFTMLADTKVLLNPDQKKAAWASVLSGIAETGNRSLMETMLKEETSDGISVASIIGQEKARAFGNAAHAVDDKNQRQRVDVEIRPFLDAAVTGNLSGGKRKDFDAWVNSNEPWVTTATRQTILNAQMGAEDRLVRGNAQAELARAIEGSRSEAQQATTSALLSGSFAFMPPQYVIGKDGMEHPFDATAHAERVLPGIAKAQGMNTAQEMQLWSTNGVENPTWKNTIAAGASNIASLGWAADGKNIGQLNEQGKAALGLYSELHQTNPAEAERYAKSNAKLFGDILFLQQRGGFPDVNTAAALVNQVQRSGINSDDVSLKRAAVTSAVQEITDPQFFSMKDNSMVATFKSIFGLAGNEDLNFMQVSADIRRRSELLVLSGQVPDAASAVEATVKYLADPAVTSKVNGTLYYNKDLPTAPNGESPGEWMEKFIADKPAAIAKERGFGDGTKVRLQPSSDGNFMAWVGGTPLTKDDGQIVTYTPKEISSWVGKKAPEEVLARAAGRNLEAYNGRTRKLLKDPRFDTALPSVVKFEGDMVPVDYVLSKENYKRLEAEGIAGGSIEDILRSTMKSRRK